MPETSVLQLADPHLAAIRMVTQAMREVESMRKLGSSLEGARYNLFQALDRELYTEAMDWLNTLETGLGFMQASDHPSAPAVGRAIRNLKEILETETEEA
jgi:hypothetical protein